MSPVELGGVGAAGQVSDGIIVMQAAKLIFAPRERDGVTPFLNANSQIEANLAIICQAGLMVPDGTLFSTVNGYSQERGPVPRKLEFKLPEFLMNAVNQKEEKFRQIGANSEKRGRVLISIIAIGYSNFLAIPISSAFYRGLLADDLYQKVANDDFSKMTKAGDDDMNKSNPPEILVKAEVMSRKEALATFHYDAPLPPKGKKLTKDEAISSFDKIMSEVNESISKLEPE